MTTLADFLLARIAEDEAVAREAIHEGGDRWEPFAERGTSIYGHPYAVGAVIGAAGGSVQVNAGAASADLAEHIARHDPARVIAECEAKRRIIDAHRKQEEDDDDMAWIVASGVLLRALALPYADHADYRPEWKP